MGPFFHVVPACQCWWTLDRIKTLAEIAAYGAALVFFIYKACAGYLITELSLTIVCIRAHCSSDTQRDDLCAAATVKKGEKGTLRLHDAQARVTEVRANPAPPTILDLIGVERLSFQPDRTKWPKKTRKKINWKLSESKPFLNLAPGDEGQFSCACQVSRTAPAVVEVVILGRRLLSLRRGQWRSSSVSLPIQP